MKKLKKGTQIEKLHDLLSKNPNGVKIPEIIKKLNLSITKLYDLKHKLLLKGFKVIRTETDMRLLSGKSKVRSYKSNSLKTPSIEKTEDIPSINKNFDNKVIKYLPLMSSEDANDCINFIKKSIFYKKCAENLIESIEYVKKFKN